MLIHNQLFFMLMDAAAIIVSFILALLARFAGLDSHAFLLGHWYGCVLLLFIYVLVMLFYQPKKTLMKRGRLDELGVVFVENLYMAMILTLILFVFKMGENSSRQFYLLFFLFDILCMYLGRLFFKALLFNHYEKEENQKRLLIYASEKNATEVVSQVLKEKMFDHEIAAVGVWRKDGTSSIYMIGRTKQGSYLKSEIKDLGEYLKKQVVDEVLLNIPDMESAQLEKLVIRLEDMGIVVHVATEMFGLKEQEKAIERLGAYRILTYCPRKFEPVELFLKRAMDIAGGIVGCLICAVLFPFVAAAIYLESPGQVIFKQIRIGKNGRRFTLYKFRSMYADAEANKKELLAKNEMDGLMFKVKDDPRITKVGKFIRKTSIDEFPQFFNVLKGDMSLVGTRPPTVDEFMQYEEHHKRRLSLKPGITGMWQVSGRSEIQNFEDVVKLDVEYIDNWSIWMDVKILVQTVLVVIGRRGAE